MTDSPEPCRAQWIEDRPATQIRTPAELEVLLRRLASEHAGEDAVLVEVSRPNGDALSIGIGHPLSVLSFVPGDGLPPYRVSLGLDEPGPGLAWYYYGRWTHFDQESLISNELALSAMREFLETGRLSAGVSWREV